MYRFGSPRVPPKHVLRHVTSVVRWSSARAQFCVSRPCDATGRRHGRTAMLRARFVLVAACFTECAQVWCMRKNRGQMSVITNALLSHPVQACDTNARVPYSANSALLSSSARKEARSQKGAKSYPPPTTTTHTHTHAPTHPPHTLPSHPTPTP